MSPEQIQQIQQILFIASIVLGVAGLACLAGAAYIFFKFDIRDIQDDLSGKKRAEAIANMDAPGTGVLRRRAKQDRSNRAQSKLAADASQQAALESKRAASSESQKQAEPVSKKASSKKPKAKKTVQKQGQQGAPIPQLDEDQATSVLVEEVDQTTMFDDDVAPAEQTSKEPAATEDKQHEFEDTDEKTIEKTTESISEMNPEASEPAGAAVPDYFKVVQRIVLTGSADFVRMEQGEGHE